MYTTYPQNNTYALQYNGYAPMQQPIPVQPMPMAAPAAQASSASMGLLVIAGAWPSSAPPPSVSFI